MPPRRRLVQPARPRLTKTELARVGKPVVKLRVDRTPAFAKRVKEVRANYDKLKGKGSGAELMTAVNKEALRQIQNLAAENLKQKVEENRTPAKFGSKRLEKAITNTKYSKATATEIKFLIPSKIRKDVPYWAAIEYGSRASVGRKVPFLILGSRKGLQTRFTSYDRFTLRHTPDWRRSNIRPDEARKRGVPEGVRRLDTQVVKYQSDRFIGPSEFKRRGYQSKRFRQRKVEVTIKRPIRPYHYGEDAAREFIRRRTWQRLLAAKRAEIRKEFGFDIYSGKQAKRRVKTGA